MSGYAWGAVVFVLVFLGLGVLLVLFLFTGRSSGVTHPSGGYVVGSVGGLPVRVGS